MRQDEFTAVFTADDITANAEAEVLKTLLESAGIPSFVRHVPPTFQRTGGVRLMVLVDDRAEAEALIREAMESAS
jgi:Putative prokaryotic signal transducing protein